MQIAALLLGCGVGAGQIDSAPVDVRSGSGWALAVPAHADIQVSPGMIRVDAPDGRRWFDIAWTDDIPGENSAMTWGESNCAPVLWDRGWGDEHRYAVGGLCGISEHRHWAFLVEERIGSRTLRTTYIGDTQRLPYEDAWVDFARTALTLGPGPAPLTPPKGDQIRAYVRAAGRETPGLSPVPGGGLLSTRVLPQLDSIWKARDAAPAGQF
jgi:hypothetical protein